MGGHGGLNILPQKRWNVYNFDNRERVRRDEEAAAQEEQIKRVKARQAELEFKLDLLREKKSQSKRRRIEHGSEGEAVEALEGGANEGAIVVRESNDGAAERPQHINFFAEYEARALEEEGHGRGQDRAKGSRRKGEDGESSRGKGEASRKERQGERGGVEKVDGKPTGEPVNENYGLGHGAVDKHGKKPWYTYKSFMVDRTTEDSERPRPDAKLQISGGSGRKADKSKKKTVEELRAERLKREQQEKDKVRKLVVAQAVKPSSTGYNRLPNGRVPQYHGSYGNR